MFAQSKGGNYSLTDGASGVADAIDFDGATDYLSRSSDLIGNADGKTFTFSAWVWNAGGYGCIYSNNDQFGDSHGITIRFDSTSLYIFGGTGGGGAVLNWFTANFVPKYTWFHVLISIDLANSANRFVFINDVSVSSTPSTYTNSNIDFTRTQHNVGSNPYGSYSNQQRFSNIYLDYTYRDLSVEANRRLFITADRKPALSQQALNPILYLPLNDPTQPGKNLGTGGDLTLNGVVARSGRGPNQFNGVYSTLNGAGQYLSKSTNLTGASNGKQLTVAFSFSTNNTSTQQLFNFAENTSERVWAYKSGANAVINCRNSAGTDIFQVVFPYVVNRNYHVVLSIDLSNAANRALSVNGATNLATWTIYTNDSFAILYSTPNIRVASSPSGTQQLAGNLGNVFFDTKYIDLSQPANLAKFVTGTGIDAKPADLGANGEKPFGTPPLIYLPMYGNNAGKNYGTGGDFTVNSGPFAGARGPNEFWGNKADFVPSAYLYQWLSLGLNKSFSASFAVTFDDSNIGRNVFSACGAEISNASVQIQRNGTNNKLLLNCQSVSGTALYAESDATFPAGSYNVQICIDVSDVNKRKVFVNGVEVAMTYSFYNNYSIAGTSFATIGAYCSHNGSSTQNYLDGKLSEFYFTTDYIDFSQEANRLKFRDAFGNPVDLAPQIAAGTLPNPAIYMRFDPANFGKNSGTGGDFTVSGTITDGGQL